MTSVPGNTASHLWRTHMHFLPFSFFAALLGRGLMSHVVSVRLPNSVLFLMWATRLAAWPSATSAFNSRSTVITSANSACGSTVGSNQTQGVCSSVDGLTIERQEHSKGLRDMVTVIQLVLLW